MGKNIVSIDEGSYSFNAGAGTITISGITNLSLENFYIITNVTTNQIIYNFAQIGQGGTLAFVDPNYTLTLEFDTSAMNNTDKLQIIMWVKSTDVTLVDKSGHISSITEGGELKVVNTTASTPPNKTKVAIYEVSDVPGNSSESDSYTIPSGEELTVNTFLAGSEDTGRSSIVELFFAPNGILDSSAEILAFAYVNGSNESFNIGETFTGDGTASIILVRTRLDAFSKEIRGRWVGYY